MKRRENLQMKDHKKMYDDAKTMAEHQKIIIEFCTTGRLDREDAIHKYTEFNHSHSEYIAAVELEGAFFHNVAPMENLSDWDIVSNLNRQLMYLGGKDLLEGLQNG